MEHRRPKLLPLFLLIGISIPFRASAGLSDPKDLELIRTLVAHNLAAYEKIKSFRIEQEWDGVDNNIYPDIPNSVPPAGRRIEKAHGTYVRRGQWFRCDYTYDMTLPDRNGLRVETRTQVILSDKLFAMAITIPQTSQTPQIISVRQSELDSIASMPISERKIADGNIPPSPVMYGFAIGANAIGRYLDNHPDVITWSVDEQRGETGTEYIVKKYNPYMGTTTYTFDASKDYLMTRKLYLDTEGKMAIDITLHPKLFNGVWLAERIDELNPLNNYERHLTVRSMEVNGPVSDAEFDFGTMEFDKDKAVLNYYARGAEPVSLVFRKGQWIPVELDEESKKMRIKPQPSVKPGE